MHRDIKSLTFDLLEPLNKKPLHKVTAYRYSIKDDTEYTEDEIKVRDPTTTDLSVKIDTILENKQLTATGLILEDNIRMIYCALAGLDEIDTCNPISEQIDIMLKIVSDPVFIQQTERTGRFYIDSLITPKRLKIYMDETKKYNREKIEICISEYLHSKMCEVSEKYTVSREDAIGFVLFLSSMSSGFLQEMSTVEGFQMIAKIHKTRLDKIRKKHNSTTLKTRNQGASSQIRNLLE